MHTISLLCCLTFAELPAERTASRASFSRDVVPAMTRAGCNSGKCHGSPHRQKNGGFRLSLFGSRPVSDFVAITDGPGGPLIDEEKPDQSRLLTVTAGKVKHPGQKLLSAESAEYKAFRAWIAQGAAPPAAKRDPLRLRVVPSDAIARPGHHIRFRVLTVDASRRESDVTHLSRIRVEHRDRTDWKRESDGRFQIAGRGRFNVVARYGSETATATVDVPHADAAAKPKWPSDSPTDRMLSARWTRMGLQPAATADNATVVRRMFVHLIGRRPTFEELSAVVDSSRHDLHSRLVDTLLSHPAYGSHWAREWRDWLNVPDGRLTAQEQQALTDWLRDRLNENASTLDIAKSLIASSGTITDNAATAFGLAHQSPQERAEAAARVFLGENIRCFRCHDHPRAGWQTDDYHALVACFAGESVKTAHGRRQLVFRPTRHRHPDTAALVRPAAFGDLLNEKTSDTRADFVTWMTRDKRQRFARAIVNRYWTALFGEGLVDDDINAFPPRPSPHSHLLTALANDFVRHGYDIKHLLRQLCSTRAYRFGTQSPNDEVVPWRGEFARRLPQRLPPQTFLHQLAHATGVPLKQIGITPEELLTLGHRRTDPAIISFIPGRCDLNSDGVPLRSSLHMINSDFLTKLLRHPEGRISRLVQSKKTDAAILDELFQVALIRPPTAAERGKCLDWMQEARQQKKRTLREAIEDILWALINTKEFLFNV